jgi:polyketide biosynthesis enoyl-CoA hydratase PksH
MTYSTLSVTTTAHALMVTLHRPERQNALNDAMLEELHAALDSAENTPGCRAFVMQGGGGTFCTGMDLEEAAQEVSGGSWKTRARFFRLLRRFTTSPRLVVSVVDGRSEGGGVGLVAASDFVFASERARFSLPEALWGLRPASVLPFLIRRTGFQLAYSMTLSTLPIDARKAEHGGLVDTVAEDPRVPLQRLLARAAKLDPATINGCKRALRELAPISDEDEAAALRELDDLFASAFVQRAFAALSGPIRRFPWEL